jgi:hydrogenase maturation protease
MKETVVLGIGNRLMEDDGIGNYVVEELKRRNALPCYRLIAGETDTDYCLDVLTDADTLILIDASDAGAQPCSVNVYQLEDVLKQPPTSLFPHNYSLIHALKQRSYEGTGILITIEAGSNTYRLGLSPDMERKFIQIVGEVQQKIDAYIKALA